MSDCNHVWRDTVMSTSKQSKEDLLMSITNAGIAGWWVKDGELDLAHELILAGKIKRCEKCIGKAVLVVQ